MVNELMSDDLFILAGSAVLPAAVPLLSNIGEILPDGSMRR